jgi:hypothetical protein
MKQTTQLEELLGRIFDDSREGLRAELPPDEYEQRRHDFVFHMTDWKDDLEWLAALYEDPDSLDEDEATTQLIGLLYHVVPHLNAAARLLLDRIDDPFAGQGDR